MQKNKNKNEFYDNRDRARNLTTKAYLFLLTVAAKQHQDTEKGHSCAFTIKFIIITSNIL